jgi:hypothetical protein
MRKLRQNHKMRKFLLFFLFPIIALGQSVQLSPNAKVSVLTCGSSPEIYAMFGHTAIRINDPDRGIDVVYNYGAFDFSTPNFALRFVKGDMQYFVTAGSFQEFINQYYYEKRSVSEQILDIPQDKKQQLFEELNSVLFSDAKYYTYKFIDRNCTNMAMDVINKTLGRKILYNRKNTETTYRNIIFPYFDGHFYEQWGTSVLFGTKVDEKATTLFLPVELEQSLATANYNGKPIVSETKKLMTFPEQKPPFSIWNNIYTYLILLAAVVLINKRGLTVFYLIIIGLFGIFFSVNGLYSMHEELAYNYNVLLFNPLLLVLGILYLRNAFKAIKITSLICLLCIAVYLIIVAAKAYFFVVLPMAIANTVILLRLFGKSRKHA